MRDTCVGIQSVIGNCGNIARDPFATCQSLFHHLKRVTGFGDKPLYLIRAPLRLWNVVFEVANYRKGWLVAVLLEEHPAQNFRL